MAKKTVEMLYIGKDSGELKQNSIIKVDMVEVKDNEGKVVDHKLPASLVGRVKSASQASEGENPLKAENDELKAKVEELEKKLASATKK